MELRDWLTGVVSNPALRPHTRERATEILEALRGGIVPAWGTVERLRVEVDESHSGPCANLMQDGACEWLREEGAEHGLNVPPRGQVCMCIFPNAWAKCPGYVKE